MLGQALDLAIRELERDPRAAARRLAGARRQAALVRGGPPRIGQRLPVLDHTGHRWCYVEVVQVALVAFGDVDPTTIDPEPDAPDWHAGRRAYDACREEFAALLGEPGWRLTDGEPMVILWYRRADQPVTAAPISGSTR